MVHRQQERRFGRDPGVDRLFLSPDQHESSVILGMIRDSLFQNFETELPCRIGRTDRRYFVVTSIDDRLSGGSRVVPAFSPDTDQASQILATLLQRYRM
jgi:hypothetical protein